MDDIVWKGNRISRLVLGTAQLGMDYGIANVQGQPTEQQAFEIIKTALGYGINCFDTALAYGNSEIVLGKALKHCGINSDLKIVSKLSPALEPSNNILIERAIEASCRNLGVDQLWCLMLHRADWLDKWDQRLHQTLIGAKQRGVVEHLGVSVYSPDNARRALEHPDIQVIQVPCNLWDQKMLKEGIFDLAKKNNKLCFVRSIYLQGLLLLSPERVAEKLSPAREASQKWHKLVADRHLGPKQLSIRFGLSLNMPLVIGAESVQQVEENIQLCEQAPLLAESTEEIRDEMSPLLNENIVNPALWGK